jgi:hypothetical protein
LIPNRPTRDARTLRAFSFVVCWRLCDGHTFNPIKETEMPTIVAPNFISVRMLDEDKHNYCKIHEATERAVGTRLKTSDVFRLALKALAEKHNVKGVK